MKESFWGKHAGAYIYKAFSRSWITTCAQAIKYLTDNPPSDTKGWRGLHIKAWTAQNDQAIEFLKQHQQRLDTQERERATPQPEQSPQAS